jgi:putative membrane fusion protein
MTDGNEASLNPAAISRLTPEKIESITTKKVEEKPNIVVKTGETFAKVIKDFDYYMVFVVSKDEAMRFKVGDTINIRINDILQVVDASVEYKSEEMDGKYVLSVKCSKYGSEISNLRRINADLIKKSYSGLKVPVSSLKNIDKENKKADIVIVESNYATMKKVAIKGINQEYAIIDNYDPQQKDGVELYNTYITDPDNIKEGQMVKQ